MNSHIGGTRFRIISKIIPFTKNLLMSKRKTATPVYLFLRFYRVYFFSVNNSVLKVKDA